MPVVKRTGLASISFVGNFCIVFPGEDLLLFNIPAVIFCPLDGYRVLSYRPGFFSTSECGLGKARSRGWDYLKQFTNRAVYGVNKESVRAAKRAWVVIFRCLKSSDRQFSLYFVLKMCVLNLGVLGWTMIATVVWKVILKRLLTWRILDILMLMLSLNKNCFRHRLEMLETWIKTRWLRKEHLFSRGYEVLVPNK